MSERVAPASVEPRVVRAPLMLGLIAFPIVFVWFLFLPGFTRSLRLVALAYTFAPVVVAAAFLMVSAAVLGIAEILGVAR